MKLEFHIDEDDFLTYQLYTASKSPMIRKRRFLASVLIPLLFILFSFILLFMNRNSMSISFFVMGVLWYFIYPYRDRINYRKNYQRYIQENYKNKLGSPVSLTFNQAYILVEDAGTETKIRISEIETVNEISTAIFIKLKKGGAIILPKNKIKNIDVFKNWIIDFTKELNIPYSAEENWRWK